VAEDDYDVVLLVEQLLSPADAQQVRSLHEGLDVPVVYHVLMPVEDAAAQVQAAMGALGSPELAPGPTLPLPAPDFEKIEDEARRAAEVALEATLAELAKVGANARGQLTTEHPVDALVAKVAEIDGAEAIILTAPHTVREFFHVDWASQARRHVGVPVLHLLEHENFDEQAGGGEGASII
jgi:nucleotide-binding universal stress UspA family protein